MRTARTVFALAFGALLAGLLAALTYGAAFIGQGLGAEDMFELRSFVERVAGVEAPVSSNARRPVPAAPGA